MNTHAKQGSPPADVATAMSVAGACSMTHRAVIKRLQICPDPIMKDMVDRQIRVKDLLYGHMQGLAHPLQVCAADDVSLIISCQSARKWSSRVCAR